MESIKRLTLTATMLLMFFASYGDNKIWPVDWINLELMIEAHKVMAKAEDAAVFELTEIEGAQFTSQSFSSKYNKTRKLLNQRMADVNSYIILTGKVATIALNLKELIEDYTKFCKNTYKNAEKHPFLVLHFASVNAQVGAEIKLLKDRCLLFESFHTNVFKATMKEKYQILDFISGNIARLDRIIWQGDLTCRSIAATGLKMYHVSDFMSNETNKKIMDKVIARWNTKAKENSEKQ